MLRILVTLATTVALTIVVAAADDDPQLKHIGGGRANGQTKRTSDFNRLGKWNQLDSVLQLRMFHRLKEAHAAAANTVTDAPDADSPNGLISVAWAYVRHEACTKGAMTFLANVKRRDVCPDVSLRRKAARRACKAASITPGNVLLSNCTHAFAASCESFFSFGGLPIESLCDAVGMTTFELRRKEEPNYDL